MGSLPTQPARATTKQLGDAAEKQALRFLQAQGLQCITRNYRTPGRGGGEIDLILRDTDGTLVFVEVRKRSKTDFGGAAASIGHAKRRRIIFTARNFLLTLRTLPPCRFDVLVLDGDAIEWLRAAFDAS
jgi:putative endonuclease